MAKILISIEVNNPDEVIANERGKLVGLASKLLSKEKRKAKVEQELNNILQQELGESLTKQLADRGIDSEIKIEIVE